MEANGLISIDHLPLEEPMQDAFEQFIKDRHTSRTSPG